MLNTMHSLKSLESDIITQMQRHCADTQFQNVELLKHEIDKCLRELIVIRQAIERLEYWIKT